MSVLPTTQTMLKRLHVARHSDDDMSHLARKMKPYLKKLLAFERAAAVNADIEMSLLKRYGDHAEDCGRWIGKMCDCGWSEVQTRLQAGRAAVVFEGVAGGV